VAPRRFIKELCATAIDQEGTNCGESLTAEAPEEHLRLGHAIQLTRRDRIAPSQTEIGQFRLTEQKNTDMEVETLTFFA